MIRFSSKELQNKTWIMELKLNKFVPWHIISIILMMWICYGVDSICSKTSRKVKVQNYLLNRNPITVLNRATSNNDPIEYGVPQGYLNDWTTMFFYQSQ